MNSRLGFGQALAAGIITGIGNIACYQAMAVGGKAAAVIPLTALYPWVTVILALAFLGERLNPIQWAGTGLALAALYIFNVSANASLLSPWLALALVPVGLWGASAFLQKLATTHASAELATLAFLLGFIPLAALIPCLAPMRWGISWADWALLLTLGLFFALGNLTLILAYGSGGEAAVVTPMASLYSLVTIPLAVALLGERITGREGAGIVLALVAVAALSLEKRPPASANPASPDSNGPC
jgi:drug/metabolite transporter (DMT)-like permease